MEVSRRGILINLIHIQLPITIRIFIYQGIIIFGITSADTPIHSEGLCLFMIGYSSVCLYYKIDNSGPLSCEMAVSRQL